MIELTVAARDSITLRCDGLCMDYLAPTADLMNSFYERNREPLAAAANEMAAFGTTAIFMDDDGKAEHIPMGRLR